jgi:hypothetical protein
MFALRGPSLRRPASASAKTRSAQTFAPDFPEATRFLSANLEGEEDPFILPAPYCPRLRPRQSRMLQAI